LLGKELSLSARRHAMVSVKTSRGDGMVIAESGRDLFEVDNDRGWVRVRPSTGARAGPGSGDVGAQIPADWPVHASAGRCVAQICPPAVAAYVCSKGGQAGLDKVFAGEQDSPVWVPYGDPGEGLARRIQHVIARHEAAHGWKPSAFLIEKRGLLASAGTPRRLLSSVRRLISACEAGLPEPDGAPISPSRAAVAEAKLALRRAVFRSLGEHSLIEHSASPTVAWYLRRRDARELVRPAAVNEIELVYAAGGPIWLEKADGKSIEATLKRAKERSERPAKCFLVKGLGLFIAGQESDLAAARDATEMGLLARAHAAGLGGIAPLTPRQRSVSAATRPRGRAGPLAELAGRIAVVTGAGSGLGRSIAVGLAKAGAAVALLDLDLRSARKSDELIRQRVPGAAVRAIQCDVTDEREVERACDSMLDAWGGLDILVNAAGIAPSYPLVDLSPDKWRAALEVNLTGYFLMAQAAARIMIRQGIGGSIINLSSKSGVDASKDNTAYNATKAGEIHMARGWALELGDHGIRVNSVAPGNVFEGSRIWNPEYIRSCAKKYGIKPDEVIPYYIDKTALKRDIKGSDVADAVVFLCSDRARTITGQTLVVDSGQVMVR
jgi:NAD(P)-dependent dehydrogenase (short-subunit alcohol dehydrogenase family)